MKQKRLIMMLAVLAAAGAAMAQGNGQAGITEATQLVTGYFDPGTKLVYAASRSTRNSVRATPTPRKPPAHGSEPAFS